MYGSLAILLAESLEAAPPYARSALSRSLVEVIARLEEGENDRRREAESELRIAQARVRREEGNRRQREMLAGLGVPDVDPAQL